MTTLAEMRFEDLQAGMQFGHALHGEQIILDLSRGLLGPAIHFHNSTVYDGEMPPPGEAEGGTSIFEAIAAKTFPYGAEGWEYRGTLAADELAAQGWHWYHVGCPHCGFVHRLLAVAPSETARRCCACGMAFVRLAQPAALD
jgi:hypothetical protein